MPDILYKYLDKRGVDLLSSSRILASCPTKMNDPFEWLPAIRDEASPEEIRRMLKNPRLRALALIDGKKIPNDPKELARTVSRLKNGAKGAAADRRRTIVEYVEKRCRIICLAQCPLNTLMWAHYAKGHDGFVVGFDTAELLRACKGSRLMEVSYSDNRPDFGSAWGEDPTGEMIDEVFRAKSRHWEYEKEYRILRLPELLQEDGGKHYQPIPTSSIRKVIIGSRPSVELERELSDVLARPLFAHIEKLRVKLDPTKYEFVLSAA
jgi:hypothetical protein